MYSRHSFTMSISGNAVSRLAQLVSSVPIGPRRPARADSSVIGVKVIELSLGTSAVVSWLKVTDVSVVLDTLLPAPIPAPLTAIPGITLAEDTKDRVSFPGGVSALVDRVSAGAASVPRLDSCDTFSISLKYATGPRGDAHGAGMQLVSDPSGLMGSKPE